MDLIDQHTPPHTHTQDKSFAMDLIDHMRQGWHLGWVTRQWWHENGLDDRVPCQVRVVTTEPEWSVRSRMPLAHGGAVGPGSPKKGGTIRIMKTLFKVIGGGVLRVAVTPRPKQPPSPPSHPHTPHPQVYEEFYAKVAHETNRRDAEFARSPFMGWDQHILHMRLVEAREYDATRLKDIQRAKTKLQMAKLAVEWELPVMTQQEWIDRQRPVRGVWGVGCGAWCVACRACGMSGVWCVGRVRVCACARVRVCVCVCVCVCACVWGRGV